MLSPDNVFIAIKPVDMRRGIDSLTQYIQDELRSTWHEGWLCASIAAFKAGFHDFSGMNFCTVDTANE